MGLDARGCNDEMTWNVPRLRGVQGVVRLGRTPALTMTTLTNPRKRRTRVSALSALSLLWLTFADAKVGPALPVSIRLRRPRCATTIRPVRDPAEFWGALPKALRACQRDTESSDAEESVHDERPGPPRRANCHSSHAHMPARQIA